MAQMALHGANFSKGSPSGIQRHNERENECYSNPEIDRNRTCLNYKLKESPVSYYKAIMERVEQRSNNSRAIRSDANILTEFVFSSSYEYMTSLSADEQWKLFEEVHNYLKEKFGEKNIVYSVVHMDERTPHLHFGFVPMTIANKLSCKEVMTRSTLLKLQDELPKRLQEKGFNITRGESSQIKHLEPVAYKAQAEKEKNRIQQESQVEAEKLQKTQQEAAQVAVDVDRLAQEAESKKKQVELLLNEKNALERQLRAFESILKEVDISIEFKKQKFSDNVTLSGEEAKRLQDAYKALKALKPLYENDKEKVKRLEESYAYYKTEYSKAFKENCKIKSDLAKIQKELNSTKKDLNDVMDWIENNPAVYEHYLLASQEQEKKAVEIKAEKSMDYEMEL